MMRAWRNGIGRPWTFASTSGSGSGRGDGDGGVTGVTVIAGFGEGASGRRLHAGVSAATTPINAQAVRSVIEDGVGYAKLSADPILHVLDPHGVGPRLEPAR